MIKLEMDKILSIGVVMINFFWLFIYCLIGECIYINFFYDYMMLILMLY